MSECGTEDKIDVGWPWDELDVNKDGTIGFWVDLTALWWSIGSGVLIGVSLAGVGVWLNWRSKRGT